MFERIRIHLLALIILFMPHWASPAWAGTGIEPPLLTLSGDKTEDTLTVTNDRGVPASYTVEAFGWEQKPSGEVILPPTAGIRVSPTNLEIPARGSAQIHVTALVPAPAPGEAEKVYRVRVSEKADRAREESEKVVQMIATITLPVFLQPLQVRPLGKIAVDPVRNGHLIVTASNAGTGHTYVKDVTVIGRDQAGKDVFQIDRHGWYVLAQGKLVFKADLSAKDCRRSHVIAVIAHVLDSDETWETSIIPGKDQCGTGKVSEFPIPGLKMRGSGAILPGVKAGQLPPPPAGSGLKGQ